MFVCTRIALLLALMLMSIAKPAWAEPLEASGGPESAARALGQQAQEPQEGQDGQEAQDAEEAPYLLTLSPRGFFGGAFGKEEDTSAAGFGLAAGLPLQHGQWELELALSALRPSGKPWLGSAELVIKRLFELERRWSPFVLLGPLVSADFKEEGPSVSVGGIAAVGLSYWVSPSLALMAQGSYRLIWEGSALNVLVLALGIELRL